MKLKMSLKWKRMKMTETKLERLQKKRTKLILKVKKLDLRIVRLGGESTID